MQRLDIITSHEGCEELCDRPQNPPAKTEGVPQSVVERQPGMLHSKLAMAHGHQSIQASQDGTKEISNMKIMEIFAKCESAQFQ